MKKVYICSPCRGDYENNIQRAKEYSRAAVEKGVIPVTPHIYLTQFMDDNVPEERELALKIGSELVLGCSELWAFGIDHPSAGMAAEIELAKAHGIPVRNGFEAISELKPDEELENSEEDKPDIGSVTLHLPAFRAMAVCNQHLDHGPISIELDGSVILELADRPDLRSGRPHRDRRLNAVTKYDPRKNAEGYNDPTPYAAEKHMMAQIRGKQARVAGGYFENIISASCDYYLSRGLAKIEKTPEPMKPLGAKNRKGQFLACYTKQAQPDYGGTLKGGRSIYFEAKHTDDERIEQRRLTQEQQDDLEAHHKLGAIAFVLVSVSLTDFYRVPWPVWRDMAEIYGRKYMTHAELSRYEVPATAGFIKFLHGIESETLGKEDAHDPTP